MVIHGCIVCLHSLLCFLRRTRPSILEHVLLPSILPQSKSHRHRHRRGFPSVYPLNPHSLRTRACIANFVTAVVPLSSGTSFAFSPLFPRTHPFAAHICHLILETSPISHRRIRSVHESKSDYADSIPSYVQLWMEQQGSG